MTVGLPGTGIGGAFYLLAALLMPVREAMRRPQSGRPRRWRMAWRQGMLAVAIVAAVWATGWLAGHLVGLIGFDSSSARLTPASAHLSNVFRAVTLAWLLGTLAAVLGVVELTRFAVHRSERSGGSAESERRAAGRPTGAALADSVSNRHGTVPDPV